MDRFLQQRRIFHRTGSQDHAFHTVFDVICNVLQRADPTTDFDRYTNGLRHLFDQCRIDAPAGLCPVQIDQMQKTGAFIDKALCQ